MGVFGAFLLLAATVMQAYVLWRAVTVPALVRLVPRNILFGAGAVLWILIALGRMLGHSSNGIAASILELIGMDWLAALFLITCCLLIVDLVTGFGYLMRGIAPALRTTALLSGLALSVIAIVQGTLPPVVRTYDVQVAGLPADQDGTVIVALSDLHLGSLIGPQWFSARVTQVQQLQPDLVVLLGDLFEGHGRPLSELLPELRRLSAPLGVWAVPGNHESFGRQTDSERLLAAAGITMLNNQQKELRPGLVIAGVEDLTMHRYVGSGDPLAATLGTQSHGATILLSHSPLRVEDAANAGVSLMLCGHTHGGQIWPFKYVVQIMYPYIAGRYSIRQMTLIVSRGTGTWGPRMRLWHRGEILRIVLHR